MDRQTDRQTDRQAGRRLDSAPSANVIAMATKVGPTCKSVRTDCPLLPPHTRVYRFARGQHQSTGAYKILESKFWALGGLNQQEAQLFLLGDRATQKHAKAS